MEKQWRSIKEFEQGIIPEQENSRGKTSGSRRNFLKLFGFGLDGVDYDADVNPVVAIANMA